MGLKVHPDGSLPTPQHKPAATGVHQSPLVHTCDMPHACRNIQAAHHHPAHTHAPTPMHPALTSSCSALAVVGGPGPCSAAQPAAEQPALLPAALGEVAAAAASWHVGCCLVGDGGGRDGRRSGSGRSGDCCPRWLLLWPSSADEASQRSSSRLCIWCASAPGATAPMAAPETMHRPVIPTTSAEPP